MGDDDGGNDSDMDVEDGSDVSSIFHTTRSGRFTTTWRASDYMWSWCIKNLEYFWA